VIYDACVNQGVYQAKDIMEDVAKKFKINLKGKSPFDVNNIKKFNGLNQKKLFDAIKDARESAYKQASTWHKHGKGWLNRLDSIDFEA
jgi:lysozyme family protein